MPSHEHNKLIKRIESLDKLPDDTAAYATWIKADGHLSLLRDNAKEDELIIHASGDYTFIVTAVVIKSSLNPLDKKALLHWGCNFFSPFASYDWGGGRDDVWIERTGYLRGSKTLEGARQLVFSRHFDGLKGKGSSYFEILQEYAHVTGIHWRPEQHAYCRFDENGDLDHVVSVTSKETQRDVALVSFKREPLEQYLAASNTVLIRMFDFTLLRRGRDFEFTSWPDDPEDVFNESEVLFYRQKVDTGKAAYTRGVQIIRPSRPKAEIFSSLKASWSGEDEKEYVEFIAWDWRNKRTTKISTDPTATTNSFHTRDNSLPFELSPAVFKPEVLLKYKADQDQYTIDERIRTIRCRSAWVLESYDINEAGQVHAYIVDLRGLPYQEQLYWLSFNEDPKGGISKRALENDFKGECTDPGPLENVLFIVRGWTESDLTWWKLREEVLLERVSTPRTSSRDEWANAFKDLSKLIIEGFQVKAIRKGLEGMDIAFDKGEKSIALLEKFLIGHSKINDGQKLEGLRTVQHIRTTFAHSGGEADDLANNALQEQKTFYAHFESVCGTVADELKLIEQAFS